MATASPVTLSKLVSRDEVAEGTTAFCFEKPGDWTFKAGQFLDMTLVDPSETDAEGNTRTFSIASAPHEETLDGGHTYAQYGIQASVKNDADWFRRKDRRTVR